MCGNNRSRRPLKVGSELMPMAPRFRSSRCRRPLKVGSERGISFSSSLPLQESPSPQGRVRTNAIVRESGLSLPESPSPQGRVRTPSPRWVTFSLLGRRPLKVGSERCSEGGRWVVEISRRPLKVGSELTEGMMMCGNNRSRRPLKVGSERSYR